LSVALKPLRERNWATFPVDPDMSTVENCLRVVRENADLFILLVGGRYGTIVDEGRSEPTAGVGGSHADLLDVRAAVTRPACAAYNCSRPTLSFI
jgi:hypothetical protein